MANLSFKINTVAKFDELAADKKVAGALYFATDSTNDDKRAYIYYHDGTDTYSIIPRLLGVANGGTGSDFTTATANSIVTMNSAADAMTTIATKSGACYASGTNGAITFGTLAVKHGGTGKTSLTKYALLVGNSTSGITTIAAVNKGYILASNGTSANPIYVLPNMSWTNGTEEGPIFNYIINEVTTVGSAVPSASANQSGVVTTVDQTFSGNKSFKGNVLPQTSAAYNLGSSSYIWKENHVQTTTWYDDDKKKNAHTTYTTGGASATEGTDGTLGYFDLYLGNNIARSSTLNTGANNAMGRLFFYGTNTGYSKLEAENTSTDNYTVKIPAADGNMVIGGGEGTSSSNATYNIPFYTSVDKIQKYNGALSFNHTNGTASATGVARLILGNNKNSTTLNNQKGYLRLYSANTGYVDITPGSSSTSNYTLYLPGASGQLVYHTNDTAIGSASQPVYVTSAGKVTACTAYSGLLTDFSSSGNNMSITIGGTIDTAPIINSISNAWTAGTTNGPSVSTTVNGVTSTAVAIPSASASASGAVTTGAQSFAGAKTFENTTNSSSKSTGAVIVKGGVGIALKLHVGSTATFDDAVNIYGNTLRIGTSTESTTISYSTSNDALTILFPS